MHDIHYFSIVNKTSKEIIKKSWWLSRVSISPNSNACVWDTEPLSVQPFYQKLNWKPMPLITVLPLQWPVSSLAKQFTKDFTRKDLGGNIKLYLLVALWFRCCSTSHRANSSSDFSKLAIMIFTHTIPYIFKSLGFILGGYQKLLLLVSCEN